MTVNRNVFIDKDIIEHAPSKPRVTGSNPVGRANSIHPTNLQTRFVASPDARRALLPAFADAIPEALGLAHETIWISEHSVQAPAGIG